MAPSRVGRIDAFVLGTVAIVAVGLVIRLASALTSPDPLFLSDATYFRLQGALLADGHGFAEPFVWVTEQRLVPSAFHPPLFSVVLGGLAWLGFDSVSAARVVSCAIGSVTVVLVALLGRRLGGDRVGLIAAGIAALTPNLWVPDGTLTSEGLAGALVAGALLLAYAIAARPRIVTAVGLGVVIGLAGLTRPETLALMFLVVVPVLVAAPGERWMRIRLFVIAAVCAAIVIGPWAVRSATVFDEPVLLSTNGQAVIGFANCDSTYHGRLLGSWSTSCPDENVALRSPDEVRDGDEAQVAIERGARGVRYLRNHPTEFVTKVVWARIGRTWSLFQPFATNHGRADEGKTPRQVQAGVVAIWLSLLLAVPGVVWLRRRHVLLLPLLGPLIVATMVSIVAYGTPRFRVIAEPSIAVMAACGVAWLLDRRRVTTASDATASDTTGVTPREDPGRMR
jgi:4-amino-4-deoxy-L-arabinose transferase-like glycosyltransferase